MRILLMGMPGAGKGTQAALLRDRLGVVHVSTGDLLREAVRSQSELGRRVQGHLDSGNLVPDDLMGVVITERLGLSDAQRGFILDGFPRTAAQVGILDNVMRQLATQIDRTCLLVADEDEIVRRLAGRRICPGCDAVYHVEDRRPQTADDCDNCGMALVQRPDDVEKVVRGRLAVYRAQTMPVIDIYRRRSLLREIDGSGDPAIVHDRLLAEVLAA